MATGNYLPIDLVGNIIPCFPALVKRGMKSPLQRQARWKELCLILAKKQKNRSSVTCFAPKGWGPQKSPLFWGKGGAGKRAIDFFKRKNQSSVTCFAPKGRGPQKSPLFWGKGGAGKRAIDFFKRKNRSSVTCSDVAGIEGFEPSECWSQNPVPYRLAISQLFFFSWLILCSCEPTTIIIPWSFLVVNTFFSLFFKITVPSFLEVFSSLHWE